jgi:hypothetical protein
MENSKYGKQIHTCRRGEFDKEAIATLLDVSFTAKPRLAIWTSTCTGTDKNGRPMTGWRNYCEYNRYEWKGIDYEIVPDEKARIFDIGEKLSIRNLNGDELVGHEDLMADIDKFTSYRRLDSLMVGDRPLNYKKLRDFYDIDIVHIDYPVIGLGKICMFENDIKDVYCNFAIQFNSFDAESSIWLNPDIIADAIRVK